LIEFVIYTGPGIHHAGASLFSENSPMQQDKKKIIQIAIAVVCLGGAIAAFFMLSPDKAGEVQTATPEAAPVEAVTPPSTAALQPKPMSEEEMTAHQSQRRGTTAPEARTKE